MSCRTVDLFSFALGAGPCFEQSGTEVEGHHAWHFDSACQGKLRPGRTANNFGLTWSPRPYIPRLDLNDAAVGWPSCLYTTPSFITKSTFFIRPMSSSGLPGTAITSAYLPALTLPKSCVCLSSAAACVVAAWIAYIGGMPACTMYTNSCAFSPCGYTPASVPNAILTPALYALPAVARIFGPTSSALRATCGGYQPSFAFSITNSPAMIVGTYQVPCAFISLMSWSSMNVPCSIESTPPSTARRIASAPCACAATVKP